MASMSQQSLDPTPKEHHCMGHYPVKLQHKLPCCTAPCVQSQGSQSMGLKRNSIISAKSSRSFKMLGRTIRFSALGSAAAGITGGCLFQLAGLGGSGGGTNLGGWGGDGGGGGSWWSHWAEHFMAFANSEDREKKYDSHGMRLNIKVSVLNLDATKKFMISGVELLDKITGKPVPPNDPFHELITMRPGGVFTKAQLQTELENLAGCGMFEKVDIDALPQIDGTLRMQVTFTESEWQPTEGLKCVNVGLLQQPPPPEGDVTKMSDRERETFIKAQEEEYRRRIRLTRPCMIEGLAEKEISQWVASERRLTARVLQRIRDQVQKWYHENGFACAQVVNFGNLNTKEIVCEVVEGDITKVIIQFQDKMGFPCEGNTHIQIVERELPKQLQAGYVFNIEAGKMALRKINSLGLFSNIEVNPRPDEETEGGIVVEVKLKELEQKTAEVSTEWSIAPGGSGWPTLATIQPGGSVTFEHRNLQGLNRSLFGSVTSNNLLNPQDDLGFKMEYVHPYLDGVYDPRNRTFKASCFNSRKLSPVFTGGPGVDEVPAIWVDRAGLKANISENFNRQSKFTYGLVLEEVTTRDETSAVCTNSARTLPNGALSMDGPPTTLSDTGIDRICFLQSNMTRDNTVFINGTPVGARYIFQVDQGLGIGSKNPVFNRHQLTLTHFVQLKKVEEGERKAPPPILVLHGRYGGCIGDLAAYDAFTLGGPYSVRGYNMGELGACRKFLELAMELRLPIMNTHTYGFVEYGTDLGSSKDVRGNPTEFFRRAGNGMSYGAGLKLGLVRAEYTRDCNTGSGSLFVRFGERF